MVTVDFLFVKKDGPLLKKVYTFVVASVTQKASLLIKLLLPVPSLNNICIEFVYSQVRMMEII